MRPARPCEEFTHPTATIGPMAAEASVNAMYARKIAETGDPGERAAYVGARLAGAETGLAGRSDATITSAPSDCAAGPAEYHLRGGCLWETI